MYRVVVEKGYLSFSAAHFISFGEECERLHGHNYTVSAELQGGLTENGYVFDFVSLKRVVREICNSLDHRFLLPQQSEHLEVEESDGEWEIRFEDRRYVLPAEDVLPLPVDNITAERLAEYVCDRLVAALQEEGAVNVNSVTVGVEESPGQAAFHRRALSEQHLR